MRISYILVFFLFLLSGYIRVFAISQEAEEKRKPVHTNKNKISGEFGLVGDRSQLDISVEHYRQSGMKGFSSADVSEVLKPTRNPEGLQNIDPHSMESMGRSKRGEYSFFNDFETDYTKPGVAGHKADIHKILTASDKKILDLTKALRKEGIDCTEEDKRATPTSPYYIDIEKEEHKEVTYNQHFCEQPVNNYSCHDAMTIHCVEKGWSHPWEPGAKEIKFTYGEIRARGWLGDEYWKSKRVWGVKRNYYKQKFFGSHESVKKEIVSRLGVKDGNIEMIRVNGDGNGGLNDLGDRHYSWNDFSAFYKYRPGHETCEKWSDARWDESCVISPK